MYHWSGNSTNIMESINLATSAVTNIPQSGASHREIFGAIWDAANGRFLLTDINTQLLSATPGGVFTSFGTITGAGSQVRGLAFVAGTLYGVAQSNALLSIPSIPRLRQL